MTDFNEIIISGVVGLVAGVVSSVVSHVLLYVSKPKIKLSKVISKKKVGETYEYRFKMVNLSKFYAKNIKILFEMVTRYNTDGGTVLKVVPIQLERNDISFIEPFNKKDKDASYATRFKIKGNLEDVWNDDARSFLRLKFYCENEFNGSGKLFIQDYHIKKKAIKEGEYKFGKSCEIG